MKTVRRLFYGDITSSVVFVALAFLSLFFFIDFVEALSDAARQGLGIWFAAGYSVLELPGHLYELAPIAVLIGSIYSLSRMAQSSEFTILRTGGLGPGRALLLLAGIGVGFGLFTLLVGDYLAPFAEQHAAQLQAKARGNAIRETSGVWLKDRLSNPQGVVQTYAVHIARTGGGGSLEGIRIFEFDANGRLVRRVAAARAEVDANTDWQLADVELTRWPVKTTTPDERESPQIDQQRLAHWTWHSSLSASMVAAAVLPLSTMSTLELRRYIGHLDANEQAAQRYEIQFWKRALYPFACLVMVALALPFAYLQTRSGGISLKVFGGIMLGISFVLLNNVAGHLGMLRHWTPWLVAAAPSALYLMMSLAAFGWLVRYR